MPAKAGIQGQHRGTRPRTPACEAVRKFKKQCLSGARAQPASPEPMNTGCENLGTAGVHGFRAQPYRLSQNDSFLFEPIF